MKPERSNYEIWLIDWLDGNLDEIRSRELMEFLEANPDLREEFDSLAAFRLSPETAFFPRKKQLLRSASDLLPTQVEYLSIASLEKDITREQMADLEFNIGQDPENKKTFEIYQKIRLFPSPLSYKNKKYLKKYPFKTRLTRYSITGLSAAAAITILILSYIFVPRLLSESENQSALFIKADSTLTEPFVVRTIVFKASSEKQVNVTPQVVTPAITPEDTASSGFRNMPDIYLAEGASKVPSKPPVPAASKIHFLNSSDIFEPVRHDILIASNNIYIQPETSDGRSRLSKFMARTFREKLLRENPGNDAPLRSYEIAEAGINGLNKLLGWEMALEEKTDEAGELKSIYFSSAVLKINAPVKKIEPLQ